MFSTTKKLLFTAILLGVGIYSINFANHSVKAMAPNPDLDDTEVLISKDNVHIEVLPDNTQIWIFNDGDRQEQRPDGTIIYASHDGIRLEIRNDNYDTVIWTYNNKTADMYVGSSLSKKGTWVENETGNRIITWDDGSTDISPALSQPTTACSM